MNIRFITLLIRGNERATGRMKLSRNQLQFQNCLFFLYCKNCQLQKGLDFFSPNQKEGSCFLEQFQRLGERLGNYQKVCSRICSCSVHQNHACPRLVQKKARSFQLLGLCCVSKWKAESSYKGDYVAIIFIIVWHLR